MSGWNIDIGAESGTSSETTLVDGSTFVVSSANGDIHERTHGLFMFDTRILSKFCCSVNGQSIEPLAVEYRGPFAATLVGRVRRNGDDIDRTIVVLRTRSVGNGLSESVEVRNYGTAPVELDITFEADVDFGSLFDVKAGRTVPLRPESIGQNSGSAFLDSRTDSPWWVRIRGSPDLLQTTAGLPYWRVELAAGATWNGCIEVTLQIGDRLFELAHPCGVPLEEALHAIRLASWRTNAATLDTDDPMLDRIFRQSQDDLGSLRIFDPDHPDRVVVAAGAPWYMTLFGRDSLLTAWMALITGPELALGVLRSLAQLQGNDINLSTEEQPGRIVHEVRYDQQTTRLLGGRNSYYGSVDATPLFVMLTGELARWGVPQSELIGLVPHVDRALDWIHTFGDRDGDGYVEYLSSAPHGLTNQGWKDSWDAIRYRNGAIAQAPLALAEVQAYVYGAYLARADLADWFDDLITAQRYRHLANELRVRFNDDFWVEDVGYYAMALDADKRKVDASASNIGHCLWTGIVADDRSAMVATQLASPALSSGFGQIGRAHV